MPYANNKGADQPAHPRSLISAFVVCCLDSTISLLSISKISSLCLASVAAQAGLSLTWLQTPKTGFLVTWLNCIHKTSLNINILHGKRLFILSFNNINVYGSKKTNWKFLHQFRITDILLKFNHLFCSKYVRFCII